MQVSVSEQVLAFVRKLSVEDVFSWREWTEYVKEHNLGFAKFSTAPLRFFLEDCIYDAVRAGIQGSEHVLDNPTDDLALCLEHVSESFATRVLRPAFAFALCHSAQGLTPERTLKLVEASMRAYVIGRERVRSQIFFCLRYALNDLFNLERRKVLETSVGQSLVRDLRELVAQYLDADRLHSPLLQALHVEVGVRSHQAL